MRPSLPGHYPGRQCVSWSLLTTSSSAPTATATRTSSSPSPTAPTSSTPCARSPAAASTGTRRSGGRRRPTTTAPYVKGVIERHPSLLVARTTSRAWLAEAATGWVGRVGGGPAATAAGAFVLETISGELPEELAASPRSAAGGSGCPFSQAAADALLELRGARLDQRALRCATRLQVGLAPAAGHARAGRERRRAALHARRQLGSRTRSPPSSRCPACEAHGRSLPIDPYLVEPLEHYLRTYGVEVGAERAATALDAPAGRARRRDRGRPPLARPRRPAARRRGRARRRAAAVPARGRRLRAATPGGRSSPTSRASARPCRRSPRSRPTTPTRRVVRLPRQPQAQLGARDRALAPAPLARRRLGHRAPSRPPPTSRSSTTTSSTRTARGWRCARPRALVLDESHYVKNPRAKRTQAVRRLAESRSRPTRCGSRSPARR